MYYIWIARKLLTILKESKENNQRINDMTL